MLGRCVKFSPSPIFAFQGLSMKRYGRVYFSLCLFLVISGRSRTQLKLNPKIPNIRYKAFVSQKNIYSHSKSNEICI